MANNSNIKIQKMPHFGPGTPYQQIPKPPKKHTTKFWGMVQFIRMSVAAGTFEGAYIAGGSLTAKISGFTVEQIARQLEKMPRPHLNEAIQALHVRQMKQKAKEINLDMLAEDWFSSKAMPLPKFPMSYPYPFYPKKLVKGYFEADEGVTLDSLAQYHPYSPPKRGTTTVSSRDEPNLPKTQKARGIMLVHQTVLSGLGVRPSPGDFQCFPVHGHFNPDRINFPVFARPCPMHPRHGFVDSRIVHTWPDVLDLYMEVLREDPEGELVFQHPLTGFYSSVATNAGVSWGLRNDGATSGPGALTIPTFGDSHDWGRRLMEPYDWMDTPELTRTELVPNTAYVELVEHEGQMTMVQLRDGPEQPTTKDFVPREIVVDNVLKFKFQDLLTWEKLVLNVAEKSPNTAVWVPQFNLSNHYSVHAIQAGLAVITGQDREPKVGDRLVPEATTPSDLTQDDIMGIKGMLTYWLERDYFMGGNYDQQREAILTGIASVHAMSGWGNAPHLLTLRAQAMVTILRAVVAACTGEMRHYWSGNGPRGEAKTTISPVNPELTALHRHEIYTEWLQPKPMKLTIRHLGNMIKDFDVESLGGTRDRNGHKVVAQGFWNASYGGKAWAQVARAAKKLAQAIVAFQKEPNLRTWKACVMAANLVVHTAHNNGVALSKWTSMLWHVANLPALGFMNSFAAETVLELNHMGNTKEAKKYLADLLTTEGVQK